VVEAFAGEGLFGVVCKGRQIGREGTVAIETITLDALRDSTTAETFLARVRDETEAHSKILHGQVLVTRSLGTGMITGGLGSHTPYAVYEWLDGRSLASSLHDDEATGLPLADAVALLGPCVEAIAGAHDLGVFHGDINAGNIFVTNDAAGPTLRVLDFGLAALVRRVVRDIAPDAPDTTLFSMVHGSPEHFDRSLGPIGPATDVYCIALVLLEVMGWVDAGELWEALKAAIEKDRKRQQAMTVPPPTNMRAATAAPTATEDGGQTFFEPLPPAPLLAAIRGRHLHGAHHLSHGHSLRSDLHGRSGARSTDERGLRRHEAARHERDRRGKAEEPACRVSHREIDQRRSSSGRSVTSGGRELRAGLSLPPPSSKNCPECGS
jgi:serine/threonine protein kinase